MKKLLFAILCPLAMIAFAGPYDIEEFTAQDVGAPDGFIEAEFGGELTKADPSAVEDIQEGRLFVRQKFEDPFGEEETTYQLYQGKAGENFGNLTALTAEGVNYSKLVSAKFYEKRGMDAKNDVPKVYFDGKSVFAENMTSLIAFVDGSPVTLKGHAPVTPEPVAAVAPANNDDEEECDEDDPDCEDEDEYDYDVKGDVTATNADADADNYSNSASNAADEAKARFGIADEVRFWTAVGLSALAAGAAVVGVLQHMKSNEAKNAYDDQKALINMVKSAVAEACLDKGPDCDAAVDWYLKNNDFSLGNDANDRPLTLETLKSRRDKNKDTMDSYAMGRNIWFGVSAASLTAAIVLFVW